MTVVPAQVTAVATIARADYGLSGKVTRLSLDTPWLSSTNLLLSVARDTTVFVQSDTVTPAGSPIPAMSRAPPSNSTACSAGCRPGPG